MSRGGFHVPFLCVPFVPFWTAFDLLLFPERTWILMARTWIYHDFCWFAFVSFWIACARQHPCVGRLGTRLIRAHMVSCGAGWRPTQHHSLAAVLGIRLLPDSVYELRVFGFVCKTALPNFWMFSPCAILEQLINTTNTTASTNITTRPTASSLLDLLSSCVNILGCSDD